MKINKNLLSYIGLSFTIGSPLVLVLLNFLHKVSGDFPEILSYIIVGACFVLPLVGVVLAIISLFSWKKVNKWSRAFSIVVLILCNPMFYFAYALVCFISGATLAGISWM